MAGRFLINTPNHKRWILPDGNHYYDSFMYGNSIKETIWKFGLPGHLDTLVMSMPTISLNNPQWKDLCDLAQELANKKFAAD